MNKTCSNCKFWTPPKSYDKDNWEFIGFDGLVGTCHKIEHFHYQGRRYCCDDIDPDAFDLIIPIASVVDGSDYRAELKTKGDFGCVLYEEKE